MDPRFSKIRAKRTHRLERHFRVETIMTFPRGTTGEAAFVSDPKRPPPVPEPSPISAAWEQEAVRMRPRLVSVARRVVRNSQEAEDAADEALARLVRERQGDNPPMRVAPWLHRTVLRIAIDRARAWVRRQEALQEVERHARRPYPGPEEVARRRELREAVWGHVLGLPLRQREVIVLHQMEGLPYGEVGELLDIAEATARAHAHAARETLRHKLASWKREAI